jgi:hypothetical protein
MRTIRRGIVAATLTVTVIVGVASAASAQAVQPPHTFDLPSPSPGMAAVGVPGATVGYRLSDQAVVVVVPDTVNVDDEALRTIEEVVWTIEPVRFRFLEVRHPERVLYRQYYRELTETFGKRPAGVEKQSLQELSDQFERAAGFYLGTPGAFMWLKAVAFAVVAFVVAIMLFVVLCVLVSAQWRRAPADAKL